MASKLKSSSRKKSFRFKVLQAEQLERREMLTVSMSNYEQLVLELVNRARANPLAEVSRNPQISDLNQGLSSGSISANAKQPLAPVQSLINAAGLYSQDMLDHDYFSHTGRNGSTPSSRAAAQGYPRGVGENIAWTGSTGSIDANVVSRALHANLVASPGHRLNMMNANYAELGTGFRLGVFTTNRAYNAGMVTEAFGNRAGNPYVTGVVYEDGQSLDDDFYSVGEGRGSVPIRAVNSSTGAAYSTSSGPSGGYSLIVPSGNYNVSAIGQNMSFTVSVGSQNVKVDFDTSQAEPASVTGQDLIAVNSANEFWGARSLGSNLETQKFGALPRSFSFTDYGVGDVNGDGLDDIVARQSDGRLHVSLSTGNLSFNTGQWSAYPSYVAWSDFHVADFTGDGRADVLARAESNGDWWLGRSTGSSFVMSNWGRFSAGVSWDVHFGDFNGDGREDIAGRAATNGAWWVGISNGSRFQISQWSRWQTSVNWHEFQVGDFDGDGMDDIAGRAYNRDWWIGRSTGSQFVASRWGSWTPSVTWEDVRVGDFNGDGRDDIAGRGNGQWWIALSNGPNLTFTNQYWGLWPTTTSWNDVQVFDSNNDGQDDIIGRAGNGEWWNYQSNGTRFVGILAARWSPGVAWSYVASGEFA